MPIYVETADNSQVAGLSPDRVCSDISFACFCQETKHNSIPAIQGPICVLCMVSVRSGGVTRSLNDRTEAGLRV